MRLIGLLIGSLSTVCTVYLFSFCFLQFNRLKFIYLEGGNLSDIGLLNEHLYKTHHILRQNFNNIFSVAASSVVSICFKTTYQLKNIPNRSIRRWQHTHTHTKHCQLPTTPPRPRTSPWVLRSLAWHAGELCGRRRRGGFLKFAGGGGLSSKEMIIETLVRFEWVSNQLTRFFRCMMCNYVVYIEDELRSYLQLYSGGFDFHTIAT